MSDSDSTLPATDDFGSRFLEFDEYSFEKPDSNEIDAFSAFLPNFQTFTDRKSSLVDDRLSAKAATHRKPVSLAVDDEEDFNTIINVKANSDSEYDSDEDEVSSFRCPKLLTARQISLQSQKDNVSTGVKTTNRFSSRPKLISLECLRPPKSPTSLTPEQIAIHQQRIASRREAAKRKAEMEKRQIVERLLKVNANVTSRRGRGRGRGLRNNGVTSYEEISFQTPSKSEVDLKVEEELSEKESDHNTPTSLQSSEDAFMKSELKHGSEESTPLPDNKLQCVSSPNVKLNIHSCNVGYIRFISSSRLSPQTVICLPPAENDNEKCAYAHTTTKHLGMTRDIPKLRLCDMGCGCVRRYECPKTGRSLCSLSCYKANLCQFLEPSLTVST